MTPELPIRYIIPSTVEYSPNVSLYTYADLCPPTLILVHIVFFVALALIP